MSEIKIIHCADLHIGATESFLGAKAKQRQAETLMTFERIVALAKENSVRYTVIAGDLFDSNSIELSLINRVFECIGEAKDVNFIFSAGNHDPLNVSSPFLNRKLPANLFVFSPAGNSFTFKEDKIRFFGKSFIEAYETPQEEFPLSAPDDDFLNVLCIHGELKSDLNSNYYPITRHFIESSKMDYIALGHIHKRTDSGLIGKTAFSYCGCPEGQGFDESGEKGVYICTLKKGDVSLEFVKTALRTHIREAVDISACLSSADAADLIIGTIKAKYGDAFNENLYRITLTGEVFEDAFISADEINARIKDKVYFSKVKDKTSYKTDLELLKSEPTLKGIFTKNMLEKIEAATDEAECENLKYALKLGLKAFNSEVVFDEN